MLVKKHKKLWKVSHSVGTRLTFRLIYSIELDMRSESFNLEIGKRVRKIRRENELTQGKLANSAGLTRSAIANIETGRQAMTAYQVYRIANALNLKNFNVLFEIPEITQSDLEKKMFGIMELTDNQRKQLSSIMDST